jgi:hypothetical protein
MINHLRLVNIDTLLFKEVIFMEFSIHGRLIVEDCKGHQEMILKLFKLLGEGNIRFVGETKEIKDK